MKISKKKLLVAILGLAMISITGLVALNDTWTSCTIQMTANTAASARIFQYKTCALGFFFFESYNWGGVTQGETYQLEYYIYNSGTLGLYITYLPTDLSFYGNQARMHIDVTVIEWGNEPCQMFTDGLPYVLPEKDPLNPQQGYFLGPGKIAKLRVELTVASVVAGGVYNFNFTIHGVNI